MKTKTELFNEFNEHLMKDEKPSEYLNSITKEDFFQRDFPLTLLNNLIKTDQSKEHHPEGNVWNHTMMVVDNAAKSKEKSSNPQVFMWAALLHDIGKAPTTKIRKGKITSYDHEKVGETLSKDFLYEFTTDSTFISDVSKLVRWHMQLLFVTKNLPFSDIKTMRKEVSIDEIALLCFCDRTGRGNITKEMITAETNEVSKFIEICKGTPPNP